MVFSMSIVVGRARMVFRTCLIIVLWRHDDERYGAGPIVIACRIDILRLPFLPHFSC